MANLTSGFNAADNLETLLPRVREIAREAGDLLMGFYQQLGDDPDAINVQIKGDNSPVTNADHASSKLLVSRLQALTPGITVVSEENSDEPADPSLFWVVDPLDGTKEFLGQTGGFFVKIALMQNYEPVLGVVRAPVFDTSYFSITGAPAWKQVGDEAPQIIHARPPREKGELTTLFNQKHADPGLYGKVSRSLRESWNIELPDQPDIRASLPRDLQVAEGLADICLNTGKDFTLKGSGGYIWDTAPDKLIAENAGALLLALYRNDRADEVSDETDEVEITRVAPLKYTGARNRSPAILAIEKNLGISRFPELKNLVPQP